MNTFYNTKPSTSLTAIFDMHLNKTNYNSASRKHNVGVLDPNNMIAYDPNKDKEELFQLKTQMNMLKEKYSFLLVHNKKLKKENELNVKMISEIIIEANKNLLKDGEPLLMESNETDEEYTRKLAGNISPESKEKLQNKYLITQLKKINEELKIKLELKDQEMTDLKQSSKVAKVNELNDKNIEMTQRLFNITDQFNRSKSYKRDYLEMKEESINLMKQVDLYKKQAFEYQLQLKHTKNELMELEQKVQEEEHNKELIVVKGTNYKMTINSYQTKLKEKEKEVVEYKEKNEKLKYEKMTITQPYEQREEKYRKKISNLAKEVEIYKQKSCAKEEQSMKYFAELEAIKSKNLSAENVKKIKRENKSLQKENASMKKELDKLNKEIEDLKKDNVKYKKDLEIEKHKVTEIARNTESNYNDFDVNDTEKKELIDLLDNKKRNADKKDEGNEKEKDKEDGSSSYYKFTDEKNDDNILKSNEGNSTFKSRIVMQNNNDGSNAYDKEYNDSGKEMKDKSEVFKFTEVKLENDSKAIEEENEKKRIDEEKERKRIDEENEKKRIDEENEKKRIDEENERKRIEEENEKRRIDEENERRRIEEENERRRIDEENERKRIDEENERKRIEEENEKRRIDEEKEKKRIDEENEKRRIDEENERIRNEEENERKRIEEENEKRRIDEENERKRIEEENDNQINVSSSNDEENDNQINISSSNEKANNSKSNLNIQNHSSKDISLEQKKNIDHLEQLNNLNKSDEEELVAVKNENEDRNINVITDKMEKSKSNKEDFIQSEEEIDQVENIQNEDLEEEEIEDSKQKNGNEGDDSESYDNNNEEDNFSRRDSN